MLTVGRAEDCAYVVSELIRGQTLAAALAGSPWPEHRVVSLGRTLADALAALHRLGLAHGQVNPENVVLMPSGPPMLVGFDFSGGRQRPAAGQSDLYALGALLFECAAGQPPSGPAGIGGQAPPLRDVNPGISPALSAVIAKLLASEPSERYTSAESLLADLDVIPLLDSTERAAASRPQPVGVLVGRDAELRRLQAHWDKALADTGQVVVIRGPTGSGKTHLAEAFLQGIANTGRLALAGRCAQDEPAPFGALRGAFEGWLAGFGRLPAAERSAAEQRLRIAAGDFASLLALFSPAFAATFPDVAPAAETELLHERFYDILANFVLKLAGCYGGLALFVDDLQWLDSSTEQVLRRLESRVAGAPLLLLASVRTGSASAPQEVLGVRPRSIRLDRLSSAATARMVAALLGVDEAPAEIAAHVVSWTGGNPLAIVEYLEALIDAGVLLPRWGAWTLDAAGLERIQLPGDLAELVASRVELLGPVALRVLRLAAVLGSRVSPRELKALADEAEVEAALDEALQAHVLRPSGPEAFAFSHDSVREALLSDVDPRELAYLHQRIAEVLSRMTDDSDGQRIYAIARHYSLGGTTQWRQVYDSNLAAGLAAMGRLGDEDAYEFLRRAADAADAGKISPSLALHEALGEVCSRTGRWDEARRHVAAALDLSNDALRRAALRARLARVYIANRAAEPAWREVEAGFADMGTPLGGSPVARLLYSAWCWIVGLLSLRLGWGYGAARGRIRRRLEALSQLCVIGAYVSYLLHDRARLLEMVVRQLYTGHLLGDSIELASGLTSYANLLALLSRTSAAEKYSARSIAIVGRVGDRFQLARMRMFQAWQQHVGGRPRQGEAAMRRCIQADGAWLDAADFAYAHIDLAWNLAMRGYCRDALEFIESALLKAQPNSGESCNLEIKAAALLAVLGRVDEAQERLRGVHERVFDPAAVWLRQSYYSFLLLILLEQGELGEPLEDALRQYRAAAPAGASHTAFHGRHFFVFQAYARLEQCTRDPSAPNIQRLQAALCELRSIRRHPTIGSHYAVIAAGLERLRGRPRSALRKLLAAQEIAFEADNMWAIFEIFRQSAHALSDLGNHEATVRQASVAYRTASIRGWVNRAGRVRVEFAGALLPDAAFEALSSAEAEHDPERIEQHLEGLLQVSLAASSTLDPARQAQVALDELLRVLRADRAFLFTVTAYGELELRAGRSASGEDLPDIEERARAVVEDVRRSGESVIAGSKRGGSGAIAAPLLMNGELLGVVYLDSRAPQGGFKESDVRILTAIANHIAIALQNASALAQQTALTRANADLLEDLRIRVEELQASRRQITAAEERLRRELAEMLHSRVQSKLLVAADQLGRAGQLMDVDPVEAKRLLFLSQSQIDDVREREVREASHLLHPSIIRIGLVPAVRSLINRFEDLFRVSLEVDPALATLDSVVDNKLPEELRLGAYRAIEEALNNIARHAHARLVEMTVGLTSERRLHIRVQDDGVGFDSAQLQPGLGLSSIDGRLNQLGGTWRIESQPGQGTKLDIELPLPAGEA